MLNRIYFSPSLFTPASTLVTVSQHEKSLPESIGLEPEESNLASVRRTVKLLLLSTDDPFYVLVRSYLQHLGFSVFTCTSAERAESLFLERCDIDIWLIDVHSLGIEAMYFATKVRDLHPEIPIILISGPLRNESSLQQLFWQDWIRVRKPAELPGLLETIHSALSGAPIALKDAREKSGLDRFDEDDVESLERFRVRNAMLN